MAKIRITSTAPDRYWLFCAGCKHTDDTADVVLASQLATRHLEQVHDDGRKHTVDMPAAMLAELYEIISILRMEIA